MFTRIVVLFICIVLTGCVDLVLYRESYTIDNMRYWEHKDSKEIASLNILNTCFNKAKSISDNYSYDKYLYAQCLYSQGYRFKTSSWLYCYHRKENCEVYDKYRK